MKKLTKRQLNKYVEEHRRECKRLKQLGRHDEILSLDGYIKYCFGQINKKQHTFKTYKAKKPENYRETPDYPSLDERSGVAANAESESYTGSYIIGIAQTHKSNAVPVINKKEILDICHMRR